MFGERKLIAQIRRLASDVKAKEVVRGIGDDCAIFKPSAGHELLVTTDLCIENVHFRREWHPAKAVGHRCLTRGLSDIAAMGGEPLTCFLSLALPRNLPQVWMNSFMKGFLALNRRFKVQLAGGDISSANQITADIILVGQIPRGRAILRSGARPGDRIYVTGSLGGSASVLQQLFSGKKIKPAKSNPHFFPIPRVVLGAWLRQRKFATSMIDLSDGLSVDLAHICEESGVSALINACQIPIAKGANLDFALHGGEDYELLFTAPKQAKIPGQIAGVSVKEIGEVKNLANYSSAIQILRQNGKISALPQQGWEHFQNALKEVGTSKKSP